MANNGIPNSGNLTPTMTLSDTDGMDLIASSLL